MNSVSSFGMNVGPDMEDAQFLMWRGLLEERTGLCVSNERRTILQTSLNIRMRELGCSDYDEYYDYIQSDVLGIIEWRALVDRVTVKETRFFRDEAAFHIVERYLEQNKERFKQGLEIWSVGCSSGEEPYGLAMLAQEQLVNEQSYAVLGTDISTLALKKARKGVYSKRTAALLPPEYQDTMLEFYNESEVQVREHIRKRCCFSQVNILDLANFPMANQHIIFCQNVLIYFRRWRRREILNILSERLAPGGLLIIGQGEMLDWCPDDLQALGQTSVSAFQKRAKTNGVER